MSKRTLLLEDLAQGMGETEAQHVVAMLRALLPKQAVVEVQPGNHWWHVYVNARYSMNARQLYIAFREGVSYANKR